MAYKHYIAVNMDWEKCIGRSPNFAGFHLTLTTSTYLLRNPNEVDVHWGKGAKPK